MEYDETTLAKMAYAQATTNPKEPSFFDQLSVRLDRMSQTLTEADGTLMSLGDRLFNGATEAGRSGGPNPVRTEPGIAERVLLAVEILQQQASAVAGRAHQINSRL